MLCERARRHRVDVKPPADVRVAAQQREHARLFVAAHVPARDCRQRRTDAVRYRPDRDAKREVVASKQPGGLSLREKEFDAEPLGLDLELLRLNLTKHPTAGAS